MGKSKLIRKKAHLKIKWAWQDVLSSIGAPMKLNVSKGEVRTVCFHGVCPDEQEYINSRFLHVSKFENLLRAFKTHFNIISLEDFQENRVASDRLNLLITFDDGYKNNLGLALPLLEKYDIPATLFCTAQNVLWMDLMDLAKANHVSLENVKLAFSELNTSNYADVKAWAIQQSEDVLKTFTAILLGSVSDHLEANTVFYQLLSNDELRFLQNHRLISLANHGAAHLSYTSQDTVSIQRDFNRCKERLEELGSPFGTVFALPFGHYNNQVLEQLLALGATHQFLAIGNPKQNTGHHDRVVINPYISVRNQMLAISHGGY